MAKHQIALKVNGIPQEAEVPSNMTLLVLLREQIGLTGTKDGCSAGECGACTVLLDGEPVNACMVLAAEVDGAEVVTIEGLIHDGQLDPLQTTMIELGATQVLTLPGALAKPTLPSACSTGSRSGISPPAGSRIGREPPGNSCSSITQVKSASPILLMFNVSVCWEPEASTMVRFSGFTSTTGRGGLGNRHHSTNVPVSPPALSVTDKTQSPL